MQLKCDCQFCIYQKANYCILDAISINDIGICEQLVKIDWDIDYLNRQKRATLKSVGDYWMLEDELTK